MATSSSGNPELDHWELFHGPNSAQYRTEAQKAFLGLFPEGHRTSLLDYVRAWRKPWVRKKWEERWDCIGLTHPHQRAWQLLLEYGQDYVPYDHPEPPPESVSVPYKCYRNAYLFMDATKQPQEDIEVSYAEGVVYSPLVRPMLHGWNTDRNGGATAYDPTLFVTCEWSRYYGIPFTAEEYESIYGRDRFGSIFHKNNFEEVEPRVRHILSKRTKRRANTGVA